MLVAGIRVKHIQVQLMIDSPHVSAASRQLIERKQCVVLLVEAVNLTGRQQLIGVEFNVGRQTSWNRRRLMRCEL